MKKIISIILGMIIFMVPLFGYAVTDTFSNITAGKNYLVYTTGDGWYTLLTYTGTTDKFKVYPDAVKVAAGFSDALFIYPYETELISQAYVYTTGEFNKSTATWTLTPGTMNFKSEPLGINALSTNCTLVGEDGFTSWEGDPNLPEVFVEPLEVGQTAHFELNEGMQSEYITVHIAADNIPNLTVRTINSANESSVSYETPSTDMMVGTSNAIDLTLNSVSYIDPTQQFVIVSSTMPMTIIGSNGQIDSPTTEIVELDDDPDTITIVNNTGVNQTISAERQSASADEYFLMTFYLTTFNTSNQLGSSPMIKDTSKRSFTLKPFQSVKIYNHKGKTWVEYPVVQGLLVTTNANGLNYVIDRIGTPDDLQIGTMPDYNPDNVPIVPSPDNGDYPDTISGFMSWIKDSITSVLMLVTGTFTGLFDLISQFSGLMAGLNIFPPAFTVLLCGALAFGLFLRVVGR